MANKNGDDWADAIAYMYSNKYQPTKTYRGIDLGQGPNNYIPTKVSATKPKPCYGCSKPAYSKYDGIYYCSDCYQPPEISFAWTVSYSIDLIDSWSNLKKLQYCGIQLDDSVLCERSTCYNCDGPLDAPFPGDDPHVACFKCRGQEGQGNFWDRPEPSPDLDMLRLQRSIQHNLKVPSQYMGLTAAPLERTCYLCHRAVDPKAAQADDDAGRLALHVSCRIQYCNENSIESIRWSTSEKIDLHQCVGTPSEQQLACYCCGSSSYRMAKKFGSVRLCLECYWFATGLVNLDKWTQPYWSNEELNISVALWETPEFLARYTGRPLGEFQTPVEEQETKPLETKPLISSVEHELYLKHMQEAIDRIFRQTISMPVRYPYSIVGI